mgnify:CR=1 FL=1
MKTVTTSKFDLISHVNQTILEQFGKIKDGTCNYLIPPNSTTPYNPISKSIYSSMNYFLLNLERHQKDFRYNAWATFNQIKKAGGKVQKNAISEKVIYYNFLYFYKNKKITKEQYQSYRISLTKKEQLLNLSAKGYMKYYNVFNFYYVDGLDGLLQEDKQLKLNTANSIHTAEKLVVKNNPRLAFEKINNAYYLPSADKIVMPQKKFFVSTYEYYATLLHELSHWTGHNSRLNRELGAIGKDLDIYAKEELIAELSSAYLLAFCKIQSDFSGAATYIDHWIKAVEKDKKFFFKSMSKAQKAFDFITTD